MDFKKKQFERALDSLCTSRGSFILFRVVLGYDAPILSSNNDIKLILLGFKMFVWRNYNNSLLEKPRAACKKFKKGQIPHYSVITMKAVAVLSSNTLTQ